VDANPDQDEFPRRFPQILWRQVPARRGVMAGAITGEFLAGGKGFGELIRVAASS
jgi:NitT/TauT family transport system permease protein